ncbi:MAG: type III pantothenate kinase [Oscillospiraceae bacterium]
MILAVDIGNTNIKVGAWDNDHLAFVSRLQTNPLSTCDEYAIRLLDIFRLGDFNRAMFDGAIISSVVPPLSGTITEAIERVIQTKRVFQIGPGLKTGLNIKIDNPATLGADMVCAGVAATAKYPLPCILISLGTATAIFAINKNAEYLGGAVAPGVKISLDALASRTAQLPHISLDHPTGIIGSNTVDSMKSGSIYGTACMLDGMIARMRDELGGEATVVATGGLSQFIIEHCREEIVYDDNIVLEGLKIIYHKNVK